MFFLYIVVCVSNLTGVCISTADFSLYSFATSWPSYNHAAVDVENLNRRLVILSRPVRRFGVLATAAAAASRPIKRKVQRSGQRRAVESRLDLERSALDSSR